MAMRALVVDDSQAMRRAIVYALSKIPGMVCDEAIDGAEALKKFNAAKPDVVITDINMPLMDGLKLISHLRQDEANSKIPIVVISTESATEDRQRAMQLGATAYLIKPVQARSVLETVKELLRLTG